MTTRQANTSLNLAWRLLVYALGGGMLLLFMMYVVSSGDPNWRDAKNGTTTN